MRRTIARFLILAGFCTALAPLVLGGQGRPGSLQNTRPGVPAPIKSRVLDLLDEEILLVHGDPESVWESDRINTVRMNRIGLRATAAEGSWPVQCRVCWQYATDDACLDSVPLVYVPYPPPAPRPIDDPTSPRPTTFTVEAEVDFSVVRGLYAHVRCVMPEVIFIGDDPDAPVDPSATLTDVKVLLRRE